MNDKRVRRRETLFHAAVLLKQTERLRYLYQQCGDDFELFKETSDLLAYYETPIPSPEFPWIKGETSALTASLPDRITTETTAYDVVRVLGEGGMGIVVLADQTSPLERRVAIKILRISLTDSEKSIARFESERQVLAMMEHAHIARVFEASRSTEGLLFFAMEYVDGVGIVEAADRYQLTIQERLRLFLDVCDAVQHAHQRGVLHRDLKPANILVERTSERCVCKVIDFGIAKATNQRILEHTIFTERGIMLGSLPHMSPEQLDCRILETDTRSDLYSLGTILFELLVGVRAVDASGTCPIEYSDFEEKILKEEVPTLTSAMKSHWGKMATIADKRRLKVSHLQHTLENDLEWIVAKCVEKERARRYPSVSFLANDLRRYLRDEPVSVGPPSRMYRFWKFLKRDRLLVFGVAATALVLLLGLFASTMIALDNRTQRDIAIKQRDELYSLSDSKRLERAIASADSLHPSSPEMIPAMETWLADKAALEDRFPEHWSRLQALRSQAEHRMEGRESSLRFANSRLQFQYEILKGLVEKLEKFLDPDPAVGTVANVRERIVFANQVRNESLVRFETEWIEAVRSIADVDESPLYDGLKIEPIIGLVPVGRDPNSGLWEFAHLRSGSVPIRNVNGELVLEEKTGLTFVLLPGGTFEMGAVTADNQEYSSGSMFREGEFPVHSIRLSPFLISKFELTQAQWCRVMEENPSTFQVGELYYVSPMQPVENVDFKMAEQASRVLGVQLPTEAQWEYAARAGSISPWIFGRTVDALDGYTNLMDITGHRSQMIMQPSFSEWDDGFGATSPVGSYLPNTFGVYDVLGNVWEWCRDPAGSYRDPVEERTGLRIATSDKHPIRGFSFAESDAYVSRRPVLASEFRDRIGLRPVIEF